MLWQKVIAAYRRKWLKKSPVHRDQLRAPTLGNEYGTGNFTKCHENSQTFQWQETPELSKVKFSHTRYRGDGPGADPGVQVVSLQVTF